MTTPRKEEKLRIIFKIISIERLYIATVIGIKD